MAGDYYHVIGGGNCGCIIIFGELSVLFYMAWRRWMDQRQGEKPKHDEERHRDDTSEAGAERDVVAQTANGQRESNEVGGRGTSSLITAVG